MNKFSFIEYLSKFFRIISAFVKVCQISMAFRLTVLWNKRFRCEDQDK